MKESLKKNRTWVIKLAAVFFVILLLLTFFSNTIMNYSLPQVATQTIQSGTITSKVRGSGTVTTANPYNVTVSSERKIKIVNVKEGDSVEQGALLVMFEDTDSSDLTQAKKTLEQAKTEYQKYIVANELSNEVVQRVENGQSGDFSGYKTRLEQAKQSVDAYQAQVDSYTSSTKKLQAQLDALQNTTADTSAEQSALDVENQELQAAQAEQTTAENTVNSLQEQYSLYQEAGNDVSGVAASLAAAKNTLMNAQNRVTNAQLAVDKAQAALTAKQDNAQNKPEISKIQTQLNSENAILSEATDNLTKAQSDHGKIMTEMNSETELAALYSAISDAQSALDKLTADGGNKITAPVSGVVSNITITKGQTVAAEETLMTITGKDNGYTATITVTSEQAKRVKTGDTADINESWYYSDIAATVTAIRNDKENPGKSKLIDLKVTGDVTEGTTLNFAIGDKSKTYDMIVPNGAVREDNNGKFILIIREKSSPLGNRYFAKRIDVDVTASDDVNSAVTGELEGYEYVITTSTKAIKAGDQVRLKKS
ncbi:putative uncharacterized protein [Roseburia sp. CAG:303]|nr:putative uncharacterized protein [Roseburia sp. CAG:303]